MCAVGLDVADTGIAAEMGRGAGRRVRPSGLAGQWKSIRGNAATDDAEATGCARTRVWPKASAMGKLLARRGRIFESSCNSIGFEDKGPIGPRSRLTYSHVSAIDVNTGSKPCGHDCQVDATYTSYPANRARRSPWAS